MGSKYPAQIFRQSLAGLLPFFFLFFTTTHLKINHNFYSETSVLVLGIALRIYVHSASQHPVVKAFNSFQIAETK